MTIIQEKVSLKKYSNFRIGGMARYFAQIESAEELIQVLDEWRRISAKFPQKDKKIFILGGGTNILISDKGFSGLVIHSLIKDIKILEEDTKILVGSGILMKDLLDFCVENSLSGLEWAGGLPGTIGGAIRGNAGAFGGEIKDSVFEIASINIQTLKLQKRKKKDCFFGYRTSIFKSLNEEIIVGAILNLKKGDKDSIKRKIKEKIDYRTDRHPLNYPNIGSIFKNIPLQNVPRKLQEEFSASVKNDPFPVLPTAKLLALAGLKGKKQGEAMVSQKHPNFIVNLGNVTSEDVLKLISEIKNIIKNKYSIELEEEITII
ncbi:MAG: UDP-N-acetylmuramate dehydrogenase [Patescibacteria group bacterium]|nr:UDP-N-acetylmuramate dehydrogenase [Patescibacteria group bacterium]